jgi:transaldolase
MKIFLDTADRTAIKKFVDTGLIDGVTTNPSHLAKEGGDPKHVVMDICKAVPTGDISVEVTQSHPKEVYLQARALAELAPNIVVKIPCHLDYFSTIKRLVDESININVTLVFSLAQALAMAKCGVRYISAMVGRWDDLDVDGVQLLYQIRDMLDRYQYDAQLLAASLRTVRHFHEAIAAGCDVATVPITLLPAAFNHLLTDRGMALFDADWKKLGIDRFP